MPANSPDNTTAGLNAAKLASATLDVKWGKRVTMLLINALPLCHCLLVALILIQPGAAWLTRLTSAFVALYLLPPVAARCILHRRPIPAGRIAIGSKEFLCWWITFQLQGVFCRITFLEELLRLVPGLYSLWLRLWGSRVGRLVYWSPGTAITDRSFLDIGDDVVLGASVRLNAHVLAKNQKGGMDLVLAPVKIGDRAVIGGYSLLTAGTEVSPGEVTHAVMLSPPFSLWKDGRRVKKQGAPDVD